MVYCLIKPNIILSFVFDPSKKKEANEIKIFDLEEDMPMKEELEKMIYEEDVHLVDGIIDGLEKINEESVLTCGEKAVMFYVNKGTLENDEISNASIKQAVGIQMYSYYYLLGDIKIGTIEDQETCEEFKL